jgi:hypothetical protein
MKQEAPGKPGTSVSDRGHVSDYRTLSGAAFQRTVGADPDKWADAAMIAAEDLGYKIDRDWLRDLLADAMETARKHSIRNVIEGDGT